MNWIRTTDPDELPTTTAAAIDFANIIEDGAETKVEAFIKSAVNWIENECRRAIMPQTWKLFLDDWPDDDLIWVPRPRLIQVDSIKYVDTDGALQTLDASGYQVDTGTEPGRVQPAYGEAWPSVRDQLSPITLEYQCGWADADSVPEDIILAIWLLVTHWYENREPIVVGTISSSLEYAVKALVSPYKIHRFDY